MSDSKFGNLIDKFNIGELAREPLNGLSAMFKSFLDSDQFNGETHFKAVVISSPKQVLPSEYQALGYTGNKSKADQSYKKFKVRITHKDQNPHALLTDPCDITLATDRCEQNALVAAHTTVVTTKHHGINIGSYITIRLKKKPDGTFNLQTAEFVDLIHTNETGETTLSAANCESIKKYFKYGEAYTPPPPIERPSEIRELAELYDSSPVPGKRQHKVFFEGGTITSASGRTQQISGFKKPFDLWVKALAYRTYELGYGPIVITSGYRTVAQQEILHQEYQARKRANPNDPSKWGLPAACGTCSRHKSGFALDLNFTDTIGVFINSKFDQQDWIDTGFVAIAESLGLSWGGFFERYDPVHFELNPKEWGDNIEMHFDTSDNHNLDTEDTGGLTEREQAALDNEVGITDEEVPENLRNAVENIRDDDADIVIPEDEELESEGEGATDLYF